MDITKSRISNAINEYWEYRKKWKPNEGVFNLKDIRDVVENATFKDTSNYIADALFAGFMIGYRKGLKDARK